MELEASKQVTTYIIKSLDEEIKRIALELHEGVSQNLYSINTGLEFINSVVDQPHLKDYIRELTETMSRTIQEVRLLSAELYPTTLEALGLSAALKSYTKLFTSTFGIVVDIVSVGEECSLSESKSVALFRVCQEALINIAKYADTSTATIYINWQPEMLQIIVEDKGKGFNLQQVIERNQCMGIAAMKQRMNIAGGECEISSVEGKGTSVSFFLPIQR